MVPLLTIFHNPMNAARISLGLSAVVFLLGSLSVYQSFKSIPEELYGTAGCRDCQHILVGGKCYS